MEMDQLGEMRAALARSGVTQREIAGELGIGESRLSKWLNTERSAPDWFADRFHTALRRLVEQKAEALVADAERKAQQLLAAVPAAEEEQVAA